MTSQRIEKNPFMHDLNVSTTPRTYWTRRLRWLRFDYIKRLLSMSNSTLIIKPSNHQHNTTSTYKLLTPSTPISSDKHSQTCNSLPSPLLPSPPWLTLLQLRTLSRFLFPPAAPRVTLLVRIYKVYNNNSTS